MTHRTAVLVAAAIVAVPLLAIRRSSQPTAPASRRADDCVAIAAPGDEGELDLVFGRRDTPAEAEELLEQVVASGTSTRSSSATAAARWKVLYDGITSYEQGLESRAEARGAGLEAELELEPP